MHDNYPEFKEKYNSMGVTPYELYLRQNSKCNLVLAYDTYEGVEVPGELYCTDGKELAPTKGLLNPTFECVQCLTSFIMEGQADKMSHYVKVNKVLLDILIATTKAIEGSKEKQTILTNKDTLSKLEDFLARTTLAQDGKEPLRFNKGELTLFGVPLDIDNDIEYGLLKFIPSKVEVGLDICKEGT